MADMRALLDDLQTEGDELDALVRSAGPDSWSTPTPASGWDVARQIAHLAWTDGVAITAASDPDGFRRYLEDMLSTATAETAATFVDDAAEAEAETPRAELLGKWRQGRADLVRALAEVPPGQKVPWFGPPMSAASMATARLMETWAHGQDIADALGVTRMPTDRLRHIAHIGVRTRDFAFLANAREVPVDEFRVELDAPGGDVWTWGQRDARQAVRGPALDFALLVTQRRHPQDLRLEASGDDAVAWLQIAQAFAGPPGGGRQPTGSDAK